MRFIKNIGVILFRYYYRIKYRHLSLKPGVKVLPKSKFHGYNSIGANSTFFGEMGHDSYIGANSFIYAEVGNFTSIGDSVKCIFSNHPSRTFVSTSPVFFSKTKQTGRTFVKKQKFQEVLLIRGKKVPVEIGNDVWIGSNVLIIGNVKIGNGAIVAAGSVVTSDVSPFSIVGGVPAREIRKRFSTDEIDKLMTDKWWDKDEEWLKENVDLFDDINKYLDYIDSIE